MTETILIKNALLLRDPLAPLIDRGYVLIADGKIADLGDMSSMPLPDNALIIDGKGQLAMPGLINAHNHCAMTLFRGLADDLELVTWLHNYIFPAEAAHVNEEMVYWCSKLAAAEMLLSGTTTVADGYFQMLQPGPFWMQACGRWSDTASSIFPPRVCRIRHVMWQRLQVSSTPGPDEIP